jgi:uncharacterized protein (TIGR02996 family)
MASVADRLEAAILADRDDTELYLVYADQLQREGDPRGELIVMQNQIQSIDDAQERHALQRTCDAWIARHQLLGPLAQFGRSVRGRDAVVTWRYGFIRCLEIGWGPQAGDTPDDARETLETILRHPSSPFITQLVLGPAPADADGRMDMQCLVDAIVDAGRLQTLRSLYLGKLTEWRRDQTSTGAIGEASAVLGRLQTLTLDAGTVALGDLAFPELEDLRITCRLLSDSELEALCAMRCPKLKRLRISIEETPGAPEAIAAVLRARLPHVRKVTATRGSYW